jgi:hypothetical protein
MRTVIGVVSGAGVLAACLSAAGATRPARRSGAHAGVIVASNVYLQGEPFDSLATLSEAMDRLGQPQPISACCGGAWRVHFAALLERPIDDATLDLEFVDVRAAAEPAPPRQVFSSPVAVRPGQTTIFVDDFVITAAQGFAAGHEYEVSLRRSGGTDRAALASGKFTLTR